MTARVDDPDGPKPGRSLAELAALIGDLTARVAEMEKVVHDGDIEAGEVRGRSLRISSVAGGPCAVIEAAPAFVSFQVRSRAALGEGVTVSLGASDEIEGGQGTIELYRRGDGVAGVRAYGTPEDPVEVWADQESSGRASGGVSALVGAVSGGLSVASRLGELEAWRASMAERVTTGVVLAERVEVRNPAHEAPSVTLSSTAGDQVHVCAGRREGPHVTIDVDRAPHSMSRDGLTVPVKAGIYLYGREADRGISLEAAVGDPGRRSFGEIVVDGPDLSYPSVVLADEIQARGAAFAWPGGEGGRVDIRAGEDYSMVSAAAVGMTDESPQVVLQASAENLDDRGRPLGETYVSVRHNDQDTVMLGCEAALGRPGAGSLRLLEGGPGRMVSTTRVQLGVRSGQAEVAVGGPDGEWVTVDAGADGSGVTISGEHGTERWGS